MFTMGISIYAVALTAAIARGNTNEIIVSLLCLMTIIGLKRIDRKRTIETTQH